MSRFIRLTAAAATLIAAVPALAADYGMYPELRPAYPDEWALSEDNPLRFEVGLRYWYSRGEQSAELGGETVSATDTSHLLEGHFRIEDLSTNSYLDGMAGYAIATDGEYSTAAAPGTVRFEGGQIGYAGADFGYMPFGTDTVRIGGLIGYQYNRESPDMARAELFDIDGLNIHSLRLGLTAKAELSDMFDVTAELAGIPYAHIWGSTPEYVFPDTTVGGLVVNRATGELNGAAYGGSAELMVGVHPTENFTIRAGGRAWLIKGPATAEVTSYDAANPSVINTVGLVVDEVLYRRLGALVEVTGRF